MRAEMIPPPQAEGTVTITMTTTEAQQMLAWLVSMGSDNYAFGLTEILYAAGLR